MKPRITPSTRTGLLPLVGLAMALWLAITGNVQAARIKEVASIEGVRSNQLTGFGLVVGLDGTGDQTTQMPYTTQGLSNYLKQLGLTLPTAQLAQLQMKNVAAVLVTAQLPAFARPGQTLDINVSSLGNSKSLKGGTLIGTPLKGADGEVYAFAQGNLIVAGAGAAAGGSKVTVNHLSVGRMPDGAQVERSVPTALQEGPTQIRRGSGPGARRSNRAGQCPCQPE
jgi:flagellar P-ring protein precursor FlgI